MKKIVFIFLLVLITMLSACSRKESVDVLIPSGGPTYAFLNMLENDENIKGYDVTYESKSGPDALIAAMTSKSHEIVVAPTNVGAKLYNAGSGYVYAGSVTFGNLFIVSKENKTLADLENKTILAFGKGSTPDIILQAILKHHDLLDSVTIEYQQSVDEARTMFLNGGYDFALLAEPVLSATKKNNELYIVSDLQQAYKNMTDLDFYPQAGVFIERSFASENEAFIKSFMNRLEESVEFVNEKKELAADYYVSHELSPTLPKDVIISSIPNSNIKFLNTKDSKGLMEDYLSLLLDFNGNTVGNKLPDADFYLNLE